MILHTAGGILDRAIEAEDKKHGDLLKLDHVEGYLELSAKTKSYFAATVALWDTDFYVKVDDDVYVLAQKEVRYHEPEYWKFGEAGNSYSLLKLLGFYNFSNMQWYHSYSLIFFGIVEYSKKNVCFIMFLDEQTLETANQRECSDERVCIGLWRIVIVRNLPYKDMHKRKGAKISITSSLPFF
ncbi:putative beta-1,3-galactosyltransferase 2 [Camellia lanceoleosa]|uniref:Beta-1,3-galactosyltransferase 2 n=1 Tax=Camellia lanceoleosa TaxID=1840588 RepID=A0ACC0FKV4_9ERIC|nr:putative beta-1,3-galactosyltransferase 2 [Camellia lanceoleosa]